MGRPSVSVVSWASSCSASMPVSLSLRHDAPQVPSRAGDDPFHFPVVALQDHDQGAGGNRRHNADAWLAKGHQVGDPDPQGGFRLHLRLEGQPLDIHPAQVPAHTLEEVAHELLELLVGGGTLSQTAVQVEVHAPLQPDIEHVRSRLFAEAVPEPSRVVTGERLKEPLRRLERLVAGDLHGGEPMLEGQGEVPGNREGGVALVTHRLGFTAGCCASPNSWWLLNRISSSSGASSAGVRVPSGTGTSGTSAGRSWPSIDSVSRTRIRWGASSSWVITMSSIQSAFCRAWGSRAS